MSNYADAMSEKGRDYARRLMAENISLAMSSEAKSQIETALTIAFLEGAMQRGRDIGEQIAELMVKMAENAGDAK